MAVGCFDRVRSYLKSHRSVGWAGAGLIGLALFLGVRFNGASASAPRGLYLLTPHLGNSPLHRGDLALFCLPASIAAEARERGYVRGWGLCPGLMPEVLKSVGAVAGDWVEVGAEGVRVNGVLHAGTRRLPFDSAGRALGGDQRRGVNSPAMFSPWLRRGPDSGASRSDAENRSRGIHPPAWGMPSGIPGASLPGASFRVPARTLFLLSPHSPRSWDSRYYGPIPLDQVRAKAHLVWSWE